MRDSNEEPSAQIILHHNVFCLNLEAFLITCLFTSENACLSLPAPLPQAAQSPVPPAAPSTAQPV